MFSVTTLINDALILALLLVGIGFFWYGSKKNNTTKKAFGGILIVFSLFETLFNYPQYANSFSAFATFLLAIGTFVLVAVTIWLEDRRTKENNRVRREQNDSDFKRRCMGDVQQWAKEGTSLFTKISLGSKPSERLIHLAPLEAMNNWIMNASRQFGEEKDLVRLVDNAAENLKQYTAWLEGTRPVDKPIELHEQCRQSFVKVLERVAHLKVELQL
jgi:hypothetical protein